MTDQELKSKIERRLSEEATVRAILGSDEELTDTERLAEVVRIHQEILRSEAERVLKTAMPGLLITDGPEDVEEDGLDDVDADDLVWEDGPLREEDQT